MAGAPQVSGRKDFLRQVAAMGWSVELMPSRRHLRFSKDGSTIIAPDRARHAKVTLNLLEHVDGFRRQRRRP
jgi:hypothetical protein